MTACHITIHSTLKFRNGLYQLYIFSEIYVSIILLEFSEILVTMHVMSVSCQLNPFVWYYGCGSMLHAKVTSACEANYITIASLVKWLWDCLELIGIRNQKHFGISVEHCRIFEQATWIQSETYLAILALGECVLRHLANTTRNVRMCYGAQLTLPELSFLPKRLHITH